ncbi:hypothetical protein EY643_11640 [Halioglobus maricola]|uniref:MACPF domain-containing protein n=1 Tax=Halioglobus maricola TaxID=2601894 RepID=A0A5P9NK94_9GAMM|nr:MAC/perforin domain-containing protein [Halioglobus maricola]QFU76260.1 hypothetical protein EY643_11640 [Halioglobus maricola]
MKAHHSKWLAVPLFALALSCSVQVFGSEESSVFTGCEKRVESAPSGNPRDRIDNRNQDVVDPFTQRAFASFSLDEVEQNDDESLASLCWLRLDGIWRQDDDPHFIGTQTGSDVWEASNAALLGLASGRYSMLNHLVIVEPKNPEEALYLSSGFGGSPFVKFVSADGIAIADIVESRAQKTYTATGQFALGNRLIVKVSASGRMLLNLGGITYERPAPNNSTEAMEAQLSANDPFLLDRTLEFVESSRRGYDVINIDPFLLWDTNTKQNVFAKLDDKKYYIEEKKIIPVNYLYQPETLQGMIYRRSLITSASQMQNTFSFSLGFDKTQAVRGVGPKASLKATQSSMERMKQSKSVAQAVAYSRTKKYTLILDYAYTSLSEDFIDAVDDARTNFRYQALIDKFGTHYPYAVTYGASAKLTKNMTSESYSQTLTESSKVAGEKGLNTGSGNFSVALSDMNGKSGTSENEEIEFIAVGGNGSWNQDGYMAGDSHPPVLLHLRPIWELLNPMYFPAQPEIYQVVRKNLEGAVNRYADSIQGDISSESLVANIKPAKKAPMEKWHIRLAEVYCTGKKVGQVKSAIVKTTIRIESDAKQTQKTSQATTKVDCKKKYSKTKHKLVASSKAQLSFTATREQLKNTRILYDVEWKYDGTLFKKHWNKETKDDPYGTSDHPLKSGKVKENKSHSYNVTFGESKWPDIKLKFVVDRLKDTQ